VKRFIVWTRRKRSFATFAAANAFAQTWFERTGVLVAITER